MSSGKPFVALLRGINVGGHNKIPMADLRALCRDTGLEDVHSYIQSGNLVFRASGTRAHLEKDLEQAIAKRFGLSIPVVVRDVRAWRAYLRANPFAQASAAAPNTVAMALSKDVPAPSAEKRLLERVTGGERVRKKGGAVWFHFADGIAKSKLTPTVIDKALGSTATLRNWRTVLKLAQLLEDL